jgi:hypothetical protein
MSAWGDNGDEIAAGIVGCGVLLALLLVLAFLTGAAVYIWRLALA